MLVLLIAGSVLGPASIDDILPGVRTVATPGIPGGVAALSEGATPLLVGKSGDHWLPIAASGTLGEGRIVAIGHDGYFGPDAAKVGDTARFLANALAWSGRKARPTVGFYEPRHGELIKSLGLPSVNLGAASAAAPDVVMLTPFGSSRKVWEPEIRRGVGAVVATTGWGWLQLNPGKHLHELPLAGTLRRAGLAFTDSMLDSARPVNSVEEASGLRFTTALNSVREGKEADEELITGAMRAVTATDPIQLEVDRLVEGTPTVIPTQAKPIRKRDTRQRLAFSVRARKAPRGADPAAADFPGAVNAGARRRELTVSVPGDHAHWASTGTYAAAGETILVDVPEELRKKGASVRIGCHSDRLWHLGEWQRSPQIDLEVRLTKPNQAVQSPFGGLVYIVVPSGGLGETVEVRLRNVVEAPRFVTGSTPLRTWQRQLAAGAPWAEIESKHLVLTVPTAAAREVADPQALADLWDRCMRLLSELDGSPIFRRKERIVADRQISAGYMHSGYPIMTWSDDSVPLSLDVKRLTTQGTWGHWHELGHNRQQGAWTFDGTGEVTNNLYTLYLMDKVAGQGIWTRLDEKQRAKAKAYQQAGADFETWKGDPFLALTMYAELTDEFGWSAVQKWFRSYIGKPAPSTDDARRDAFLTNFSRTVGRDLSPFFRRWGVPTTPESGKSLADLPAWSGRPITGS